VALASTTHVVKKTNVQKTTLLDVVIYRAALRCRPFRQSSVIPTRQEQRARITRAGLLTCASLDSLSPSHPVKDSGL
jgi:hypothetical protein